MRVNEGLHVSGPVVVLLRKQQFLHQLKPEHDSTYTSSIFLSFHRFCGALSYRFSLYRAHSVIIGHGPIHISRADIL